MSYARIYSATLIGSLVYPVTIEVDIQPGLPTFSIIGLPDRRIEESKERIRAAIKNSGLQFPLGRITVNLSPSSLPKHGTGFDLGIALGIIRAAAHNKTSFPEWVIGELRLNGQVNPVSRIIPLLLQAAKLQIKGCLIPATNEVQGRLFPELSLCLIKHLKDAVSGLKFKYLAPLLLPPGSLPQQWQLDLIKSQIKAKRALLIALAGGHNLFLTGPPGSGKTMLARAAWELLPPLSRPEMLTIATIHAAAELPYDLLHPVRPFRIADGQASLRTLLGGGSQGQPGEFGLAHGGLLFLDEFAEMPRSTQEALRLPLQHKQVTLVRGGVTYRYPADCIIIAAQNDCACGLKGQGKECRCTPGDLERYARRVSEPIYDRFALFAETHALAAAEWKEEPATAGLYYEQIMKARHLQAERLGVDRTNNQLTDQEFQGLLAGQDEALAYINKASRRWYLSSRSMRHILLVARTIADLAGQKQIGLTHIQEALQYRRRR